VGFQLFTLKKRDKYMFTKRFGKKHLTFEFRNGTGLDIEFADSRPVWIIDTETGELSAMAFKGIILLLPLIVITYGEVHQEMEVIFDGKT
jgi:hypothetical protein|tara:strand:+ start:540 stop:809 length:270 start_codon:yes stop_codon:yes gene_type:complete